MLLYAGIDEAGYGPLLGPLVVARSVFAVEEAAPETALPCLWSTLARAVCRRPGDPKGRVAFNDSKALYVPSAGLAHLERGVLSLLALLETPTSADALLCRFAVDAESRVPRHPWYAGGEPGSRLPVDLRPEELAEARTKLGRCAERAGVRLADAAVAVVYEDRFNRMVETTSSKAACAWHFVALHLRAIWERFGDLCPTVVLDRQGGRRYYRELLCAVFPEAQVTALDEVAAASRYRIAARGRALDLRVQVESEKDHLPAACSSMLAKYTRELLMLRFRDFWAREAPDVRPTWGYVVDGRRFLRDLAPHLERLGVDPSALARRL